MNTRHPSRRVSRPLTAYEVRDFDRDAADYIMHLLFMNTADHRPQQGRDQERRRVDQFH